MTLVQSSSSPLFLTDGGLETTLIFHEHVELPSFAAFILLQHQDGRAILRRYFERYLAIAERTGAGFVLEAPTWRSNPDWGHKLGLSLKEIDAVNHDAIELMRELRAAWQARVPELVVSGCVGPRGDGYQPDRLMSAEEAERYHAPQVQAFADAGADMTTVMTMNYVNEAIGFARAARAAKLPSVVSFTVETDGKLPTGETLREAILAVERETDRAPAHYMINCAHPSHFERVLEPGAAWTERIGALRANASRRSHQELNDSPELDAGNPAELGAQLRALRERFPHIKVLGGCCGTDDRHLACVGEACAHAA